MLAQFGFGVFVLTFLLALFSVGAAVVGYFDKSDRWVEAARRAMQLTFPLISLATLMLAYLVRQLVDTSASRTAGWKPPGVPCN